MATRTSVGSGLWSAAGTWDTGVPVDGDAVVITGGVTVTFDVDQSPMPNGITTLTISSTSTFQASTSPGSYRLKASGNITVNSNCRFLVGSATTPYPDACTCVIQLTGANNLTGSGEIGLYASHPATRYCRLTAPYVTPADDHVHVALPTAQQGGWDIGDTVRIDDLLSVDSQTGVISAIADNLITMAVTRPAGDKAVGSVCILQTRNVRVTGATSYAVNVATKLHFGAELSGCARGITTSDGCEISGVLAGGGANTGVDGCQNGLVSGIVSGWSTAVNLLTAGQMSGVVSGSGTGVGYTCGAVISGLVSGCGYGLIYCGGLIVTGEVSGCFAAVSKSTCRLVGATLGLNRDRDVGWSSIEARNTRFLTTPEVVLFSTGAGLGVAAVLCYSYDHDQVVGASRAWTAGGTVSDTASPVVTGRPRSYAHACASATYPCWHQREITVDAGRQLRARVWLRHGAGVAVVAQLVLPTDDPLLDPSATAEDEFDATMLDHDEWHEHVLTWTNTASYPQQILLRFLATAAAGNAYSDFEWAFDRSPGGRHGIA